MRMMIMTTSLTWLIKREMIVMKGIMTMAGIVMTLIMIEVVEERVLGEGGSHVIVNVIREVLVGIGIQVHTEGMIGLSLVGVMIVLDQGLLEVEAMEEIIEKIVMKKIDMKGLRGEGIGKRNESVNIILWYVFLVTVCFSTHYLRENKTE